MFGLIAGVLFGLGLLVGTHAGYIDGVTDERLANKNRLEACQQLTVANMFQEQ